LFCFSATSLHNCASSTLSLDIPKKSRPGVLQHQTSLCEPAVTRPPIRFNGTPVTVRSMSAELHHRRPSSTDDTIMTNSRIVTRDDVTQCHSSKVGVRGEKRTRKRFRKSKPFCLSVIMANFSTFCSQTSLHGWQYIAQRNSSSAKHVFWGIVVSMSMATAALFLYNNTMDYLNATVSF
jgi:hypothetical protein